jgi:hypothetical protein
LSIEPSAVVSDFHCTGNSACAIVPIAARCSGLSVLSKYRTAHSICPFEKSAPRSVAIQNLAPSSRVAP